MSLEDQIKHLEHLVAYSEGILMYFNRIGYNNEEDVNKCLESLYLNTEILKSLKKFKEIT